jgi:hypothetical protein
LTIHLRPQQQRFFSPRDFLIPMHVRADGLRNFPIECALWEPASTFRLRMCADDYRKGAAQYANDIPRRRAEGVLHVSQHKVQTEFQNAKENSSLFIGKYAFVVRHAYKKHDYCYVFFLLIIKTGTQENSKY